jgi:hypothetical protein
MVLEGDYLHYEDISWEPATDDFDIQSLTISQSVIYMYTPLSHRAPLYREGIFQQK